MLSINLYGIGSATLIETTLPAYAASLTASTVQACRILSDISEYDLSSETFGKG